jgi:hypothetical protein
VVAKINKAEIFSLYFQFTPLHKHQKQNKMEGKEGKEKMKEEKRLLALYILNKIFSLRSY